MADVVVADVVVTDVVRERPVGAPSARFSRVRCESCAMPVRGNQNRCWSCGLDVRIEPGPLPAPPDGEVVPAPKARAPHRARLVGAGLLLVVIAGSVAVLGQGERGPGVRGLAARVRGEAWQRAEIRGASAEFPGAPAREATGPGGGLPRAGERLRADHGGLRTELLVADVADAGTLVDASAAAQQIVDGFAAGRSGMVVERTPLHLGGAPGVDAVVQRGDEPIRVRVTVAGTTAYLLAVTGQAEAFDRFSKSFHRSPTAAPGRAEAD